MAKRLTPEEFIREFLQRGFTRDQILARANKKDRNFYQMVKDSLQHITLIEALEGQVENSNQAIINFENPTYSSKTLLKDINRIKEQKQKKSNGRSDLAIHTDIEMDDLLAPINGFNNKVSFTALKKTPKKKSPESNESLISLYDESESDTLPVTDKIEIKKIEQNSSDKTSILPVTEETQQPFETANSVTQEEVSYYDGLPHKKLVSIINKQNLRLKENNQTIKTKEDKIVRSFTAADKLRTTLNQKIETLKKRSRRYQIAFYSVAIMFISTGITFKILDMQNAGDSSNKAGLYVSLPKEKTKETIENPPIAKEEIFENQGDFTAGLDLSDENDTDGDSIADETTNNSETDLEESNPETDSDSIDKQEDNEDQEVAAETTPTPEPLVHVVKRGDNWWKIAKKYLGSNKAHQYKKIQKFNKLKKDTITIGQKIKIPTSAELE